MNRFFTPLILVLPAALLLSGCVKETQLTPGGAKVEFIENVDVIKDKLRDEEKCKLVAELRVQAKNPMGMPGSRMEREGKERMVRARNMAAENKANVLIAMGDVKDHEQKFNAYACK